MQQIMRRVRAPWNNYNDTVGGTRFTDSLSEPVTEYEATRIAAALGGLIVPVDDQEAELVVLDEEMPLAAVVAKKAADRLQTSQPTPDAPEAPASASQRPARGKAVEGKRKPRAKRGD